MQMHACAIIHLIAQGQVHGLTFFSVAQNYRFNIWDTLHRF